MGVTVEMIVRVTIAIGIAVFLWSISSSMEQIARALTRIADSRDVDRSRPPGGGV